MNIYKIKGYKDRDNYLECLSEDYAVDLEVVLALSDLLGEEEDFDGLLTELEALSRWN